MAGEAETITVTMKREDAETLIRRVAFRCDNPAKLAVDHDDFAGFIIALMAVQKELLKQ
jgi:hypothetical protein